MVAARAAAKTLPRGSRCVVLLADSVRNYMTKFLNDDYMWRLGFIDLDHGIGRGDVSHERDWWGGRPVGELKLTTPVTVTPDVTCAEAVEILQSLGFDQLPVVDDNSAILGVVTEGNITSKLLAGRVKPTDPITRALFSQFRSVNVATQLATVARIFDRDAFVIVTQTQKTMGRGGAVSEKNICVGVLSRIDLLKYITAGTSVEGSPVSAGGGRRAGLVPVPSVMSLTAAAAARQ
jgi:cystathionine beta-synthase